MFEDRVVNNLLLLYLIDKTNEIGNMEDNLKVQKMVFLAQKDLIKRRLKAFAYNFFRWDQGPFSADLNNDLVKLARNDFLRWESWNKKMYLTKDGKGLLDACKEAFEENEVFLRSIDAIIGKFAEVEPEAIKNEVYGMRLMVPKIRKQMVIREIPHRQLILFRPSMKRMRREFKISDDWLATLEVAFDEEAVATVRKAYSDAKEGNVHGASI